MPLSSSCRMQRWLRMLPLSFPSLTRWVPSSPRGERRSGGTTGDRASPYSALTASRCVPDRSHRLLAAALLALALAAPPAHIAAQALPAPAAQAEPRIPAKAMVHILARHGPDSTAPGAGKYAPGTTETTIRFLIAEALAHGTPAPDSNFRPATLYDYRFPYIIGTTIDGAPTNRIRVVVGRDGAVVTAYPR